MKIVEVEKKLYMLAFDDARVPGSGYSFPCDEDGKILWYECSSVKATRKSLAYCKSHPERWTSESRDGRVVEVIDWERYGICPCCGCKVYFYGSGYMGAYKCACGHWYNVFGQALKPPDDWEEPMEAEPDF